MLPEQQKSGDVFVNNCLSKNVFVPIELALLKEDLRKAVICMLLERQLYGNEQFMQLWKETQLKEFQAKIGFEYMTCSIPMWTMYPNGKISG